RRPFHAVARGAEPHRARLARAAGRDAVRRLRAGRDTRADGRGAGARVHAGARTRGRARAPGPARHDAGDGNRSRDRGAARPPGRALHRGNPHDRHDGRLREGAMTTPSAAQKAFAARPETTGNVASAAPMTGAEYLASLDDGREVYIYGERVAKVTEH